MTLYPASLENGKPHMCTQKNFSVAGETACVIQVESVTITPNASLTPPSLPYWGRGSLTTPRSYLSPLLLVLF